MILKLLLLACALSLALGNSLNNQPKEDCTPDNCNPPNCRCSSTGIPGGLDPEETPQMVHITFNDNLINMHYEKYFSNLIGMTNPDGCPISPTYFVSHEYCDYSNAHNLHAAGHEIALHSISHVVSTEYWMNLDLEGYKQEFMGQKIIIEKFANISGDSIQGIRLPQLVHGNTSYQMLAEVGLSWDSSWPTLSQTEPGLWPYTLDYSSTQDCPTGSCPTAPIPGVWVVPMLSWKDNGGNNCIMVDACVDSPTNQEELTQFMITNFERSYKGNKAPFGFFVHAAWFDNTDHPYRWPAFMDFVSYLNGLPDVFIVGPTRALQWVKNPSPLSNLEVSWPECQPNYEPSCNAITCDVRRYDEPGRRYWFKHCDSECPDYYPWLGNPTGSGP